jgi:hypothetical protein
MFRWLFGRDPHKKQNHDIRMPDVDELPNIEEVFDKARSAAAGQGEPPPGVSGRHVVIVTPGRMLMFHPCPPPGSMPKKQVASMEAMISPKVKRNIAAIAYTELGAVTEAPTTIPFFGILMGLAYIGHSVWIFEGHSSALAAGCKDADVLIVDSSMVPFLRNDWAPAASGAMRRAEIYLHDRATYSLRKIG